MSKKKKKHICRQCSKELDQLDGLFYHWQKVMIALSVLENEECITHATHADLLDSMLNLKGLVMNHDDACQENDPDQGEIMFEGEPSKEITLELSSVTGVTKDNFDKIVIKLEEMFGKDIKEAIGDIMESSIWPPDMSPEEQRKGLEKSDEIILQFLKLRKEK